MIADKEVKLSDLISINIKGNAPATGLIVTSRQLKEEETSNSRMTPDRQRIADYLISPEPVRSYLIAHKIISEWIQQDTRKNKPIMRLETQEFLEEKIREEGFRPGPPGKQGTWLTSTIPHSESPTIERTIRQALKAFSEMIGNRVIHIFGREN